MSYNIFGGIFIQVLDKADLPQVIETAQKAMTESLRSSTSAECIRSSGSTPEKTECLRSQMVQQQQPESPEEPDIPDIPERPERQERQERQEMQADTTQLSDCGGTPPGTAQAEAALSESAGTAPAGTPPGTAPAEAALFESAGTPPEKELRFKYISAEAVSRGVADIVERDLKEAALGSAPELARCIRQEEISGNLLTASVSSKKLFRELKMHFNIQYNYRNFVKARQ